MSLHHKRVKRTHKKKVVAVIVLASMFGGIEANASYFDVLMDFIRSFIATGHKERDAQQIVEGLTLSTSQTAIAPVEISEMMDASAKAYAATYFAERQTFRIKDVIDGMSVGEPETIDTETGEKNPVIVGRGVSQGFTCEALAEKTVIQSKGLIRDVENYNAGMRLSQRFASQPTVKQANRTTRHLEKYCDISEAAQGLCPMVIGDMASADTEYAFLHEKDALSNDDAEAAYAYVLNVVDPTTTKIDDCDTPVCNKITAVETAYQAFSNVAQGAFINQINDRLYFEYQGSPAGESLGINTNIQVTADATTP